MTISWNLVIMILFLYIGIWVTLFYLWDLASKGVKKIWRYFKPDVAKE